MGIDGSRTGTFIDDATSSGVAGGNAFIEPLAFMSSPMNLAALDATEAPRE